MSVEQFNPLDVSFTIINTAFEAFCTVILFNGYFTKKHDNGIWRNTIFIALCLTTLWLLVWPISVALPIGAFSYVMIIGAKILVCYICYAVNKKQVKTIVFISAISTAVALIIDLILLFVIQISIPVSLDTLREDSYIDGIMGMVARILFFLCVIAWLVLVRKTPLESQTISKGGAIFVFTPLITITALYSMAVAQNQTHRTTLISIISTVGLFLLNIVVFYLFEQAIENEVANRKRLLGDQQVEIEMRNARRAIEILVGEQKMVHDYKKHIAVVQALLREGKQVAAQTYVDAMRFDTESYAIYAYSGIISVDIVIGQMMEKCKQMNITLELHISPTRSIPLSDKEIVTVLSNVLENAIEATNQVKKNRIVKLKFEVDEFNLWISVRNPVKVNITIYENKIPTTKENKETHGLGLQNVADVVGAHHGTYELFCSENMFQFTTMIPF